MADNDFVAIFRLVGISTMEKSAEGCINPSTILKNLQTVQVCHCQNK